MGEKQNIPLLLGSLLYESAFYTRAADFFRISIDTFGKECSVLYNMALSCYYAGETKVARSYLSDLLDIDPSYPPALKFLKGFY
jgi:tetratricopeptide (TPR) repeat protein